MLEKFLIDYINDLYNKQNINMKPEQQNLYTKMQYYELLKPVIDVVNTYKDYSLEEMRSILFQKSGIEEKVTDFIYNKEMIPGMVCSYGTQKYKETIVIGNKQEVTLDQNDHTVSALEKMTEDTIFDLASVTKLFTSLGILKLVESNLIKIDDEICKYAPQFKNLKGVNIFDLLSFRVPLRTTGRVDRVASKEEGEKILFNIEIDNDSNNNRPYTDMGAMVLKYVIESVSGMSLYNYIDGNILKKLNLTDTHVKIPNYKLDRVASTNLDAKYYKDGNVLVTKEATKGIVYDPKAQIMGQQDGDLSGHAELFSTANDMTVLAQGIINGQILNDKYVAYMAKNRTGKKYVIDNKNQYIQYLGYLCYSKHPNLGDSELFHAMSGRSFASAGWTGTQLTVDPINHLYLFMAGNRSHNRMTFIDPVQREKVKEDKNGKKTITLPDGTTRIDATRFAWDRDEVVVHPALKLSIQYKMLEDIYELMNEKVEANEKIRYLNKSNNYSKI
ncbi:MAG: serine hydrolase [Bacilli bacterium]|nr:serine hydrolase [Bacilli bacterium]